jgi:hypothetical protein
VDLPDNESSGIWQKKPDQPRAKRISFSHEQSAAKVGFLMRPSSEAREQYGNIAGAKTA